MRRYSFSRYDEFRVFEVINVYDLLRFFIIRSGV